jgi:hypothetical protein
MTVIFRKGVNSPLDGISKIVFGAAWDRKTAKQAGWARKLAVKTGGKINVGGGEKDIDLDLALVLYRDGQPKRIVIGHNPNPVPGVNHSEPASTRPRTSRSTSTTAAGVRPSCSTS